MNGDVTKPGTDRDQNRATSRTFIAIDLPTTLLRAVAQSQAQLQTYLRGHNGDAALRWSPTENLHLTLRFLGETTAQQREQVIARLQDVAAVAAPFTLHVDVSGRGLGGFPNLRQPRVLWMGLGGELDRLGRLQIEMEQIAQAVGFVPETKGYSPHLTLARAARGADRRALSQVGQAIRDYAQSFVAPEPLSFAVDRVLFYRSELGAGGARYTVLAALPFGGV
jgi:2'-5' RNA ligase